MSSLDKARKFHASLNVSDLARSIAFYRVLFGVEVAKQRPDYAKFELDDPPLVLSLIPGRPGAGGNLNHVGLRVPGSEALVEMQRRVEAAGFPARREDGVECCYALQTKFWVTDPDRTLWEIYVFHEDVDEHGVGSVPDVDHAFAKDVPRQPAVWEHRIPDPLSASIPHADNSLDEARLQGSVNVKGEIGPLLREVFRALRPGGSVRIHGLAGDRPLDQELPPLPGPAAVVEYVPAAIDPMRAMVEAGFIDVRFEKLSKTAHFTVAGVKMREILLVGRKPGYRPKKLSHHAVYLGPLAQVTDDFGNVFPRGERVLLNIQDWQVLANGAAAEQFVFFTPEQMAVLEPCCSS